MTWISDTLSNALVERLGWALVHSLWQGLAIVAIAAGLLRLLRKRSAASRYLTACIALVAVLALPIATACLLRPESPATAHADETPAVSGAGRADADGKPPEADRQDTRPPGIDGRAFRRFPYRRPNFERAPRRGRFGADRYGTYAISDPTGSIAPQAAPPSTASVLKGWISRTSNALRPVMPWLVAAWLIGVLALSARHVWAWTHLARLRRAGAESVGAEIISQMRDLGRRLGVGRAVAVMRSALVRVPTVVGWLRPVILLPAEALTGLSREQLGAVLAHELAHIRRHDYLVNLLQVAVETLLFYHPGVWWLSRRIRDERENCCDDLAVRACGQPVLYARALAAVASIAAQPALAVAATGGPLLGRVRRIVGLPPQPHRGEGLLAGALTLLTVLVLAAVLGVSCASDTPALAETREPTTRPAEAATPADSSARGPSHSEADSPVFDIPRLEGIVIDGKADDWGERGFRVDAMSTFDGPLEADESFDPRFRVGWNDEGLLLILLVKDDTPVEHNDIRSLWNGDGIELFFADARGGTQQWQPTFAPGRTASHPKLRSYTFDNREAPKVGTRELKLRAERTCSDKGYVMEILLPWDSLAIRPELGREVALQAYIDSVDAEGNKTTGYWYPADGTHSDTTRMYALRLAKEPSPPYRTAGTVESRRWAGWKKLPADGARKLDLRIVHKDTGKPVGGYRIGVQLDGEQYYTRVDEQGRAPIALPDEGVRQVRVTVRAKGLVPVHATWPLKDVPRQYTLQLEPGTSIGGVIRDQDGRPVPDAKVYLLLPNQGRTGPERWAIYEHLEKTDQQGRWRCDLMPAEFREIWIRLAHPEYNSDSHYNSSGVPPIAQLRDFTAVMTLSKGLSLAGTVTDSDGKPVEGAALIMGPDRFGSHLPTAVTNAHGQYRFRHCSAGHNLVTVQAKGYAPELKEVHIDRTTKPLDFRLEPGRTIRGRVVDEDGKPIPAAGVAVDTWRGHRSLKWRVQTDADGRFEWNDAPADTVLIDIFPAGYMSVRNTPMAAREEEYVIALHPPLHVHGSVVDAETGEPVPQFKVIPGVVFASRGATTGSTSWNRTDAKECRDGQYEVSRSFPYHGHQIRIEAEGYLPVDSRVFRSDEKSQEFNFRLTRGGGIEGRAVLPNGQPAAGADVQLVLSGQRTSVHIRNGRWRFFNDHIPKTKTDSEGRFSFPPQHEMWMLLLLHEHGLAEVDSEAFGESPVIHLEPWASIEGTVRIGDELSAEAEVDVNPVNLRLQEQDANQPVVYYDIGANTDSHGRYSIRLVPPGETVVGRKVVWQTRAGRTWLSGTNRTVFVNLQPGQKARVDIGGKGRPVVGRLVCRPPRGDIDISLARGVVQTKVEFPKRPDMTPAENWEQLTDEEKVAARAAVLASEEYKKYKAARDAAIAKRRRGTHYSFFMQSDGTFRIEDVIPGTYELNILLFGPSSPGQGGPGEMLGRTSMDFTVKEIPGGRSDEPQDLGEIPLTVITNVGARDAAPPFEVPEIDGETLKLADFCGRYVLLDFWATWCGPCIGETPHLNAVWEAYGNDPRFAMIGLSLDKTMDRPREYAKENGLQWHQGFLGEWSKAALPSRYGVRGIPSIWLIDPQGNVAAKNLRGEGILTAVRQALGPPRASLPAAERADDREEEAFLLPTEGRTVLSAHGDKVRMQVKGRTREGERFVIFAPDPAGKEERAVYVVTCCDSGVRARPRTAPRG